MIEDIKKEATRSGLVIKSLSSLYEIISLNFIITDNKKDMKERG